MWSLTSNMPASGKTISASQRFSTASETRQIRSRNKGNWMIRKLYPKFPNNLLGGFPFPLLSRMLRTREDRNASDLRQPFLEQFNAFANEFKRQITHTGEISSGVCNALNKLAIDRITAETEHNRYRSL